MQLLEIKIPEAGLFPPKQLRYTAIGAKITLKALSLFSVKSADAVKPDPRNLFCEVL
jgi:hypothetical protein